MVVILIILLIALVALIAVLVSNTLKFTPEPKEESVKENVIFDGDVAVSNLAELVKCKTVSYYDKEKEDDKEFKKLLNKLPKLYPNVFKACEYMTFEDRGILFKWKGKKKGDATVLMAHYDVVPVEEEQWTKPAFTALIEGDIMWGRGTVDTKVSMNGILTAANTLIGQKFKPDNDIYFAFSGGEEVNGDGAKHIVNYFKENNITLSCVLDEGGAVVKDVFPGVKEACGLVGIAEKGLMNVQFDAKSNGGHASAPAPHTPIGVLSKACYKVENHPFPKHFTEPVLLMFDKLGRRSTFLYRMIFANLWFFGPILDMICKKSGGELNALVRTTCAFTQMEGSDAPNVVPPTASMVANLRLNPNDTVNEAVDYLKKVINDKDVEITLLQGTNPSIVSKIDCIGYKRVEKAVSDTYDCIVSPYLMVQCSDSRHYNEISDKVYKFSSYDLTAEERHSIHGNDEHIRLEAIKHSVEFFMRLMKQC